MKHLFLLFLLACLPFAGKSQQGISMEEIGKLSPAEQAEAIILYHRMVDTIAWNPTLSLFLEEMISNPDHFQLSAHQLAQLFLIKGKQDFLVTNMDAAILNFEKSLQLAHSVGDLELKAQIQQEIGCTYRSLENFEPATEWLEKAFEFFKGQGNSSNLAELQFCLGTALTFTGKGEKAFPLLKDAVDMYSNLGNPRSALATACEVAAIFLEKGELEKAKYFGFQALELIKNHHPAQRDWQPELLLSKAYFKEENYPEALKYGKLASDVPGLGSRLVNQAATQLQLAQVYGKLGNFSQAKFHLLNAENQIDNLEPDSQNTLDLIYSIAENWSSLKEFSKAQDTYKRYYQAQKNWIRIREKELVSTMNSNFGEKELALKTKTHGELSQAFHEKFTLTKWFLWSIILLLAAAVAGWYRAYRIQGKENMHLKENKATIEQQQQELTHKNEKLDQLNQQLLQEISERESLEKHTFERDKFLTTMTHRMGTSINSIVGLTHLLLQESPRPDQKEQLKTLQFATNNLVVFINDVLDFSKIEAGKLTLDQLDFYPRILFNDLREQFEKESEELALTLKFAYNQQIPKLLNGDPARLNQILNNLMMTAFKYTREGGVDMRFELEHETDSHVLLRIEVDDTGRPIDETILGHVFNQVDNQYLIDQTNTVTFSLTIARRLVELQGGKFEILADENSGNHFRIWLPFKKTGKGQSSKATAEYLEKRLQGHHVLLVEDNRINQLVIAKLLRNVGMEITTANNGLEAVEMMKKADFDLVLMDIQMPEMDGYKATAEIRKMDNPLKKSVPIIALTASAFLTHEEKAKLFGMNDHVGKPFSPNELLEKLEKFLGVKNMRKS